MLSNHKKHGFQQTSESPCNKARELQLKKKRKKKKRRVKLKKSPRPLYLLFSYVLAMKLLGCKHIVKDYEFDSMKIPNQSGIQKTTRPHPRSSESYRPQLMLLIIRCKKQQLSKKLTFSSRGSKLRNVKFLIGANGWSMQVGDILKATRSQPSTQISTFDWYLYLCQ